MLTLRARYVFPVVSGPLAEGFVRISGENIVAVGEKVSGTFYDLGNVAILPGLVNTHVHLEFSDLAKPLGEPGIGLSDWIRLLLEYRRQASTDGRSPIDPITHGINESIRSGVTLLGEIAQPGWSVDGIASMPLSMTVYRELIAPGADRVPAALAAAKSWLNHENCGASRTHPTRIHWRPGLSPHAPYSVHPELLKATLAMSAAERCPVAMHVAESREELELLRCGSGPLRLFLEERGEWRDSGAGTGVASGTHMRPMLFLRQLAAAHRALVIHGNYLDDEEIAFLAAKASRMAVVYCPRSHDWFAHAPYPLEKMSAAGVAVALGTDGRGSAPDLSLLAEMRFAARQHPAIGRDRILAMGTLAGARALGWEHCLGSLAPGKQADLAIVALPDRDAADRYELLFDSVEPLVGCYCRGKPLGGMRDEG